MKFLSELNCSNPDISAASYALIDLSPATAGKLIDLHTQARAFLGVISKTGIINEFFAPEFALTIAPFDAYNHTEELQTALDGAASGEKIVKLPADTKFQIDAETGEERVECFRVLFSESYMQFSAVAKYGDHRLTTTCISLELIQEAAKEAA